MLVDVKMPKLGESITEGTIIEWLKKVGDNIEKDENLLEIGTDKVDSEIPSPVSGIVKELLAQPNDVVPVYDVIARIETDADAAVEEPKTMEKETEPEVELKEDAIQALEPEPVVEEVAPEPPVSDEPVKGDRKYYTPLVRSIARKEGITESELQSIHGSGKGARVTKHNILSFLEKRSILSVEISEMADQVPSAPSVGMGDEIVEMDRMRQIIADHMRKSLDTAAHVHLVSECDVSLMVQYVKEKQTAFQNREGFKLTYTPFFVMAAVKAIQDFHLFNASLDGTRIIKRKNINMGIAVAIDKGLMVPVINNCEELNFLGLCRKVKDVAERSRKGQITPEELQGSTFSITNFGVFGNLYGTPVINQPNSAILGIGVVKKRPIVRETDDGDAIVIRSMTYLSLGFDHRLLDGAGGGKFLQKMVHYLETLDTNSLL